MNTTMNQPKPGSILRTRQQPTDKPAMKRTSFKDDVFNKKRRESQISLAASEGTNDDSKQSAKNYELVPRTSTHSSIPHPSRISKRSSDNSKETTSTGTASRTGTLGSSASLRWLKPLFNFFRIRDSHVKIMKEVLNNKVWKAFILCLTLILLFGGSIQEFCPKEVDPVFDVVFMVTLVVLMLDIFMMCYAVPMYFVFRPSMKRKVDGDDVGCLCFAFQFGSFLFWFDFISVISLLYEISFINIALNQVSEAKVFVSPTGIPLLISTQNSHSLNLNTNLMISVISRTARVARLLRIDVIGKMQYLIASSNEAIRSQKTCSELFRRDAKVSEEIKIEAAKKIQNAWRAQSKQGQVIGAFRSAGSQARVGKTSQNTNVSSMSVRTTANAMRGVGGVNNSSTSNTAKEKDQNNASKRTSLFKKEESTKKQKTKRKKKKKSQIGSVMNEITTRRVAVGMLISIIMTTVFTYMENQAYNVVTVVSMHNTMVSLQNETDKTLNSHVRLLTQVAKDSSTPSLCDYTFTTQNGTFVSETFCFEEIIETIRNRNILSVKVCSIENENDYNCDGAVSESLILCKQNAELVGVVSLVFTLFLLFSWTIGLLFFLGPVKTLVVSPIERMIRLFTMLEDPLGYSRTKEYRIFMKEDNELAKNTMWTQESLNGMETSFLMSTILRIGSLMKVGFGSAGVEMVRSNLQKSTRANIYQGFGATVACIFMFCDIRGFTDSSECLNEEVFVFTNRIAAVVHSYCHAYGGSANKNIGDAFLLSWQLDQQDPSRSSQNDDDIDQGFYAKRAQADKALLAVVKICIALYHENFFLEGLSEHSVSALKKKFAKRAGNLVQLGFGLHAGSAVEGAIGSLRKVDATYLSEAVESSEFLESSTKEYGVNVLMSGEFHSLLHRNVKDKCRKIDDIFTSEEIEMVNQDDLNMMDENDDGKHMSLHTFDMDIDALFKKKVRRTTDSDATSDHGMAREDSVRSRQGSFRHIDNSRHKSSSGILNGSLLSRRRKSLFNGESPQDKKEKELFGSVEDTKETEERRKLEIPDGTLIYQPTVWDEHEDILAIRERFTPNFYDKFKEGYLAYFKGEWEVARNIFELLVKDFDDKPSALYLKRMKKAKSSTQISNLSWRYNSKMHKNL